MRETPTDTTRRLVALFVGGTIVVSLALVVGTQVFSPEAPAPTASAPTSAGDTASAPTHVANVASVTPVARQRSSTTSSTFPTPVSNDAPDEATLMSELRAIKGRDPKRALELAREGNRRFPNTPEAAERAASIVHALSDLGRASEARGEAEDMVNRYPDGEWVREVEQFTGAHRHRNVRVNAEGKLEFYDPPPVGDSP